MIEKLKEQAKKLKISDFGVVKAKVYKDLCLALREGNVSEFVKESPNDRSNPFLVMPNAKSLIVCLFSYNIEKEGNISKYAMGKDYHQLIRQKLLEFSKPLTDAGFSAMPFSDSWCMNERFLATKAGLGFVGKNHNFISEKFGSFCFIGVVLTDCELKENFPVKKDCISCGECIKNCPGNALENGGFDEKKCLSYITQKKGGLEDWEKDLIIKGNKVWGCDICQDVCPHNKGIAPTEIEEFLTDLITNLEIPKEMSERDFKRLYGDRAFSWRGKGVILRNQQILKR